jgi:hypothetical protein
MYLFMYLFVGSLDLRLVGGAGDTEDSVVVFSHCLALAVIRFLCVALDSGLVCC